MTIPPRLAARRQAIHAAARQLSLSDDERRALIAGQTGGKRSTTQLNLAECEAVLEYMRQQGATRPKRVRNVGQHPGNPESAKPGAGALMEKIEAQLADMKLPWAYAVSILKHVSADKLLGKPGVERLEWATPAQLTKVVAALDYEQTKRVLLAGVDDALARRGLDRAWVEAWLATNLPDGLPNWTRKTKVLRVVGAVLAGAGAD